jgi:PAP2 superfamily
MKTEITKTPGGLRRIAAAALAAAVALAVVTACSRSIPTLEELQPQAANSIDPGAGNWKMILLSGPTQFTVAAPAAVSSDAYQSELAAIKTAQANLTQAQRDAIDYWGGGAVLRWNQILRELVARYNLPPAPRDNGTYVFPDANNPFADPAFPFANPPYAARAYSYVTVAQFEALKAAWYYKYQYNRPSPSRVDSSIQALMPTTDLPAYPSEDAVLSGVTTEILRLLFPAAVEEITRRAGEQRDAALQSGKATASDIAAGLALGRAVAAVFGARAGSDGMGAAVGNAAQWQAFADAAAARGEIPWKSLETPPRPPMLPNFGKVLAWMMTPTDVARERPGPPPSTSSSQMAQDVVEVRDTLDHLSREQLAIALKWNDGAATYTPPGHWNDIATEYVRDARMSEVRAARTFALLNMAMHDAAVSCWDAKFAYFNPRPSQMDPRIKTSIGLPNFPSYTSGHSTFSAAAAVVLSYLFPAGASSFESMREEAAISRLYGGIHYRSDIQTGKDHGARIGGYTVTFARQDGAD